MGHKAINVITPQVRMLQFGWPLSHAVITLLLVLHSNTIYRVVYITTPAMELLERHLAQFHSAEI